MCCYEVEVEYLMLEHEVKALKKVLSILLRSSSVSSFMLQCFFELHAYIEE